MLKNEFKQEKYTLVDRACIHLDQVIRALTGNVHTTGSPYPGNAVAEGDLSKEEQNHSAGLMRVNHAGEICAQALYHGQAMVSRSAQTAASLQQAALEEGDHLHWCQKRLDELNSHTSYLNPVWYTGSFCIGMLAGMVGDEWSLGFVAETETQVIKHLHGHLSALPENDVRSHRILTQMEKEETHHRDEAIAQGAKTLPTPIKIGMAWTAKVMVKTAYWI